PGPRLADSGKAMAHITDTAFAGDFRLDRHTERVSEQSRRVFDADRRAAADIEGTPDGVIADQRQATGLGDIIDIDEIAALLAIFEDQWRAVVQQTRGKNRQDAAIGVRERLVRPVDIEEPQRHGRDVVGVADHQAETLLVVFRQRVDRADRWRLAL